MANGNPWEFTGKDAGIGFLGGMLQRYLQLNDRNAQFQQQKDMLEQRGAQSQQLLTAQAETQDKLARERDAERQEFEIRQAETSLQQKMALDAIMRGRDLEQIRDETAVKAEMLKKHPELFPDQNAAARIPYEDAEMALKNFEDRVLGYDLAPWARSQMITGIMAGDDPRDHFGRIQQFSEDEGLDHRMPIPFDEGRTKIAALAEILVDQYKFARDAALPVAEEMFVTGEKDPTEAQRSVNIKRTSRGVEDALEPALGQDLQMGQRFIPMEKVIETYRKERGTQSAPPFDQYVEIDPAIGMLVPISPDEVVMALYDAQWDQDSIQRFFEDIWGLSKSADPAELGRSLERFQSDPFGMILRGGHRALGAGIGAADAATLGGRVPFPTPGSGK